MDRNVAALKKVAPEEVLTTQELAKYRRSKPETKTYIQLGSKMKEAQQKYDDELSEIRNHESEKRLQLERKRTERTILEKDTDIEITEQINKTLENVFKTTHAQQRLEERGVEVVRLIGALKIRNDHVKLSTLNSNFQHYGTLNIIRGSDGKEIEEIYIDEEIGGWSRKLTLETSDFDLSKKSRLFSKREDFQKAMREQGIPHHIAFYITKNDGKVRQILIESPEDSLEVKLQNRNQYSSKQLLFGRDDNPKQLKIILNPPMQGIITMYFTGGKRHGHVKSTKQVTDTGRMKKGELRTIFTSGSAEMNDDDKYNGGGAL